MDQWVKLNASTAGKDKAFRLVQYLSRLVWHNLDSRKNLRDAVARLKIIESSFSSFRKRPGASFFQEITLTTVDFIESASKILGNSSGTNTHIVLRFGKSLEVLHGALRTLHLPDVCLRVILTMSRIYQSMFLLMDHIIWIGRAGLFDINKEKWAKYANRFWLGSIILNLIRDFYEIMLIVQRSAACKNPLPCAYKKYPVVKTVYDCIPATRPIVMFVEEHQDVFWDSLKNFCDFWIPLTSLGHTNLSPGMVGFLGSVSSFAGLIAVLDPLAKLAPM